MVGKISDGPHGLTEMQPAETLTLGPNVASEPSGMLRFLNGVLQQEFRVLTYYTNESGERSMTTKSKMSFEWRDVPFVGEP